MLDQRDLWLNLVLAAAVKESVTWSQVSTLAREWTRKNPNIRLTGGKKEDARAIQPAPSLYTVRLGKWRGSVHSSQSWMTGKDGSTAHNYLLTNSNLWPLKCLTRVRLCKYKGTLRCLRGYNGETNCRLTVLSACKKGIIPLHAHAVFFALLTAIWK